MCANPRPVWDSNLSPLYYLILLTKAFEKLKIDNQKLYCFYFCNIKTTIIRNSLNSNEPSYFSLERAKKPKLDNGFGRRRSTTGSFTESLNIQMGKQRQYSFAKEPTRAPVIDSSSTSDLEIRSPVYMRYGRDLPDPPFEEGRLTPNSIRSEATYAEIMSPLPAPTKQHKLRLKLRHKIFIPLIIFLGHVFTCSKDTQLGTWKVTFLSLYRMVIFVKTSSSVSNNYTAPCESFIWSMFIWSVPSFTYLHETSIFIRLRGFLCGCYVWKWRCLLLKWQRCMQLYRWLFWCQVWIFNEWRLLKIFKNTNCGGGEFIMFNPVWAVLIDTTILPMLISVYICFYVKI